MLEEDSETTRSGPEWVIRTSELERRGARRADFEAENDALGTVAQALAGGAADVLQILADALLRVCNAHSAGVGVLEADDAGALVHWRGAAGRLAALAGLKVPQACTPCGAALARNEALLAVHVEWNYPLPLEVTPPNLEWLTVPFHLDGRPVGTLWVIAHDEGRKFDAQDRRVLESLGRLAAAACRLLDAARADAALRARARELETVMELVPAVVFVAEDAEGRTIRTNRAGRALLDLQPGANVSKSAPDSEAPSTFKVYRNGVEVPPDALPVQLAARGETIENYEEDIVHPDGTVRHWIGNATPLRDDEGRSVGAVAAFIDITERKRAEEALLEADRRKDEFLATLAHELRNPLAPLRNALQILASSGDAAPVVEKCRAIMERQVAQMVRLIDDLLDVSRISRGKIELRKARVDLTQLAHQAVESIAPLIEASGHHLTVEVPSTPIVLDADHARLVQVIGNLLSNACKFTSPGGRIDLSLATEGSEAVLRVRDSGKGIAADRFGRIFEMFAQIDAPLDRTHSGLGIGLTLVKSLTAMHGGTVEVRSAGSGQGSEFVVRLPVPVLPEPPNDASPEPQTPGVGRHRILVVDDNADAADSLATLLALSGHDTHTAYDGVTAIQSAATFAPDVVLLDIGLPELNGYEVARKLRARPGGERLLLVAITGWGQQTDRQRSEAAGFDVHLVKPVEQATLTRLLAALEPNSLTN